MVNNSIRSNYNYPHYVELIDKHSEEEQKESDARELAKVHEWLMGGVP